MVETIHIREATSDDVPQILAVLKAALGEPPLLRRTRELFNWKHGNNPFGRSIVLLAMDADRIAGVRAFMRWELITPAGDTVRCVRAVDTATHPDYARQGIFRRLTLEALEVARDEGVHLVFNTPNAQSGAGYMNMGWSEVGSIGAMVRPRLGKSVNVDSGSAPTLEASLPGVSTFATTNIDDRAPRGLRTPRNAEYLAWRFTGHPSARYGWVADGASGGAVVRTSMRAGRVETIVSDLLGSGGSSSLRRVARTSRSRYVATWFSPGSPERRQAIRAGIVPIPRLRTLRLVANPLIDLAINPLDLDSWDLATSDLELL